MKKIGIFYAAKADKTSWVTKCTLTVPVKSENGWEKQAKR